MSDPAVSVIIPAYNCADLVGQAIDSVRQQTYADFEVLVVDDGSTDATWEVIQKQEAEWDKLRAFRIDHGGLAAARNAALGHMRGQWIALLDSDDLWLPTKLERCMAYLAEHPDLSIVYTPMDPILPDGTPIEGHSKPCHAGRLTERLFHSIFVHDPATVFHRRVIDTVGPFDESLPVCIGHEFWLRVSMQFEFGLIDEPLALRRWSEQTLTRSNRSRGRCVKAGVLERFFFERGGRELLTDVPRALRRLASVSYKAGKILLAEHRPREARSYLAKAIRRSPGLIKAYPYYLAALIASPFCGRPAKQA